jgi:mono/diheme cytochrome c family protein
MLKALYVAGGIQDAAEKIDHSSPRPAVVPEDVTPEYGAYVGALCVGCHGAGLSGGRIPGTPPSWPPAANLTTAPDSAMQHYESAGAFRTMMRSGKRPDGSKINTVMPFESLMRMNDLELDAVFAFLKKTQPRTTGTR